MLILISVSGCANGIAGSNYCDIYEPVYITAEDSEITKMQVDRNNVVYDELCR